MNDDYVVINAVRTATKGNSRATATGVPWFVVPIYLSIPPANMSNPWEELVGQIVLGQQDIGFTGEFGNDFPDDALAVRPDWLRFSDWVSANANPWEWNFSSGVEMGDSAMSIFWNTQQEILPAGAQPISDIALLFSVPPPLDNANFSSLVLSGATFNPPFRMNPFDFPEGVMNYTYIDSKIAIGYTHPTYGTRPFTYSYPDFATSYNTVGVDGNFYTPSSGLTYVTTLQNNYYNPYLWGRVMKVDDYEGIYVIEWVTKAWRFIGSLGLDFLTFYWEIRNYESVSHGINFRVLYDLMMHGYDETWFSKSTDQSFQGTSAQYSLDGIGYGWDSLPVERGVGSVATVDSSIRVFSDPKLISTSQFDASTTYRDAKTTFDVQ